MNYRIFTRTFWKVNNSGKWPNKLEPHLGRKTTIATASTEGEALSICKVWNANNKPGKLSRKAEYMEV